MTDYFYGRVSSEEQAREGISVESQIMIALKSGILRQNIYVDEARSGGIKEDDFEIINTPEHYGIIIDKKKRPAFAKILGLLKPGDSLRFTIWSRISRNLLAQEMFVMDCNKRKIKLIPLQDTEHPVARQVMGAVNQQYLDGISKDVTRVQQQQYEQGIHPGKAPYGYWKNSKQKNGMLLKPELEQGIYPEPKQAEKVKLAFTMTIQGINYKDICKATGLTTGMYYSIIKNIIYIGNITFRGEIKKGKHQPLITQKEYDQANQQITS